MKISIFKIFVLFSIISACKHTNQNINSTSKPIQYPQTININEGFKQRKDLPLSEIASDIEYVKLEFTKNSMIKELRGISITDDYIFITSLGVPYVMQFDRKGKFIRQIGTIGRGPKEYILCLYFTVNEKTRQILIRSYGTRKIFCYDFNGVYQKSIDTNGQISQFVTLSTGEIVCSAIWDNWTNPENFIVLTLDGKGDTVFLKKSWFYSNFKSTFFSNNIICSNKDSVFINEYYRDTIYLYKNRNLIPHFILLWDNLKDPDIYSMMSYGEKEIRDNSAKIFHLKLFQTTSNYFYMYYQYQYKNYLGRFNKKTKELYFYEGLNQQGCLKNDFDGGISVNPLFDAGNNKWVSELSADNILHSLTSQYLATSQAKYPEKREELKLFVENLTENDNPLIMIITLK